MQDYYVDKLIYDNMQNIYVDMELTCIYVNMQYGYVDSHANYLCQHARLLF